MGEPPLGSLKPQQKGAPSKTARPHLSLSTSARSECCVLWHFSGGPAQGTVTNGVLLFSLQTNLGRVPTQATTQSKNSKNRKPSCESPLAKLGSVSSRLLDFLSAVALMTFASMRACALQNKCIFLRVCVAGTVFAQLLSYLNNGFSICAELAACRAILPAFEASRILLLGTANNANHPQ